MKKYILLIVCLFLLPKVVFALEVAPNSKSFILIEANSGKIIYEKEKDKRLSIASLTKMVAQIIILEEIEKGNIKWSDVVTASKNASGMGGSQIYLEENEKMTVQDLMKGISVASGNDATVAMAEYISGSEEKFVSRMNKKVKELGLKNTHFSNCTGLDEKNHYSSAYDLAIIARELVVNHPEILRFSSIYEDYLRENTSNKFWLVNTNKLIRQYEGVDGLKTGHTDDALYCLAATIKKNDLRLIGIILGESDSKVRNREMIDLLEYGFNNTKVVNLKNRGEVVKNISLKKADKNNIKALLKDNLVVIEESGIKKKKYSYEVNINDIKLPINTGDKIGIIKVLDNKKVVSSSDLVSDSSVRALDLINLYWNNLKDIVFGNF